MTIISLKPTIKDENLFFGTFKDESPLRFKNYTNKTPTIITICKFKLNLILNI